MIKAKKSLLIPLFILLGFYFVYQARFFIFGPSIAIENPKEGEVLTSAAVAVNGTAHNAAYLTLNGSPIFTDAKGHFSEKLILSPGMSIIEVKARDHFGREKIKNIRVTL